MNKNIRTMLGTAQILGVLVLVAIFFIWGANPNNESEEEDSVETSEVAASDVNSIEFKDATDDQLLIIARQLRDKYKQLQQETDIEKYDQLRKELFLDYELNAPLEPFLPYINYQATVSNENIVKYVNKGYFHYEYDVVESYTTADGQKEISKGFVSISVFQGENGIYKIAMIL